MADREKEWLEKIAKADEFARTKSLGKDRPHCLVQTSRDKIEIALYSELAPLLKIGDWAVITASPQKFVIWTEMFKKIIEDAQKKQREKS